eukprot:TRINITY_DN31778_c0_g1_i1.p1 TRINITY_DN31778_c0_g1~~TRINITY_DN31778_c0_g1_i1.p1  ORF type:complete len:118 (-),score=2.01 TRINITY_DN31778_c0_g1_i1:183-536(-)
MSLYPIVVCNYFKKKKQDSLDVSRVVEIVASDPVFTGRVIGLASKAIYGKTPRNTQEAISRNLGINTVINMAVIYGVKDALESQVEQRVIDQSTHAFFDCSEVFSANAQICREGNQI